MSGNYFQVLGVEAALGRTLLPSDERAPGREPVAVISEGLWRRAFGGRSDVIGSTILVNAQPLTVVGVAEPSFHGAVLAMLLDVFIPLTMRPCVAVGIMTMPSQRATRVDPAIALRAE